MDTCTATSRLRKNSVYAKNTVEIFRMALGPESPQDVQKGRPRHPSFVSGKFPSLRDTFHEGRFTVLVLAVFFSILLGRKGGPLPQPERRIPDSRGFASIVPSFFTCAVSQFTVNRGAIMLNGRWVAMLSAVGLLLVLQGCAETST